MNSRYDYSSDDRESPRYSSQQRRPMEPEGDDKRHEHPDDEPGKITMEGVGEEGVGDDQNNNDVTGGEDAVLDLAELEQLQEEAERMKGLGNKHMAAQVSLTKCS